MIFFPMITQSNISFTSLLLNSFIEVADVVDGSGEQLLLRFLVVYGDYSNSHNDDGSFLLPEGSFLSFPKSIAFVRV